ncbi:MAG: LPS export ABC transporter periplasmic protein LptC [Crocinitomicaceae bacterium]|nr:LPS export ABC transporter periplasmic protein LptC [Crocinitomicaceae bacterium]|tara:strand:- start:10628 stop:11197 length:570 start_codon:yes stop_codon:yes gene_type:complete
MHLDVTRESLIKISSVFVLISVLFSCVNDIDKIQKITYSEDAPDDVMRELNLFYNDSGYTRIKIYAELAETYMFPNHITKLKDGVKVDFYSEEGEIVSKLTSIYGEINYETGKFFVRDSVELLNVKKGQRLETEELFWNQNDSIIYTNKNVLIKSNDNSIEGLGRGIETTQKFDNYKILEPYGKFDLSK